MTVKEKKKTQKVLPTVLSSDTNRPMYDLTKRFLDLYISLFFIFGWAPVLLLIALAIKLESAGPILYSQKRIGKNGMPFTLFKFRTMYVNPDSVVFHEQLLKDILQQTSGDHKLPFLVNDLRVTRVGKFLRKTSLDELPFLISVIRGNMSLVGPRPPFEYEWRSYSPEQRQRLSVIPGMTGPSQIQYSRHLNFEEMLQLDLHYIENRSISLDLKILLETIKTFIFGH